MSGEELKKLDIGDLVEYDGMGLKGISTVIDIKRNSAFPIGIIVEEKKLIFCIKEIRVIGKANQISLEMLREIL